MDFNRFKQLKLPLLKSKKTDSDKIQQMAIRSNIKGLEKIFSSSGKLEIRIEAVKALAKIGSANAIIALQGFSNIPTETHLHDEIMKQLSEAMKSYQQSHTVDSALNAKAKKKLAIGKLNVTPFAFRKKK